MSPHEDIGGDGRIGTDLPSVFDGLGGWVRSATSFVPDHQPGRAFLEAAIATGKTPWIALQFCDPVSDNANRAAVMNGWARRWQGKGALVYGWWRYEHRPDPVPPHVTGIPAWLANPEDPEEMEDVDELVLNVPALITLPKAEAVPAPLLNRYRTHLIAECFRETDKSDGTIEESRLFWIEAGLDPDLWRPALQAYGTPFAPLPEQARQSRKVGARGVSVYPVEGADPDDLRAIGGIFS